MIDMLRRILTSTIHVRIEYRIELIGGVLPHIDFCGSFIRFMAGRER